MTLDEFMFLRRYNTVDKCKKCGMRVRSQDFASDMKAVFTCTNCKSNWAWPLRRRTPKFYKKIMDEFKTINYYTSIPDNKAWLIENGCTEDVICEQCRNESKCEVLSSWLGKS